MLKRRLLKQLQAISDGEQKQIKRLQRLRDEDAELIADEELLEVYPELVKKEVARVARQAEKQARKDEQIAKYLEVHPDIAEQIIRGEIERANRKTDVKYFGKVLDKFSRDELLRRYLSEVKLSSFGPTNEEEMKKIVKRYDTPEYDNARLKRELRDKAMENESKNSKKASSSGVPSASREDRVVPVQLPPIPISSPAERDLRRIGRMLREGVEEEEATPKPSETHKRPRGRPRKNKEKTDNYKATTDDGYEVTG